VDLLMPRHRWRRWSFPRWAARRRAIHIRKRTLLHAALERAEVVIPDGQLFLQLWYYAPER